MVFFFLLLLPAQVRNHAATNLTIHLHLVRHPSNAIQTGRANSPDHEMTPRKKGDTLLLHLMMVGYTFKAFLSLCLLEIVHRTFGKTKALRYSDHRVQHSTLYFFGCSQDP
jgi:hypothetical protein